jgi:hypothetical protein
MMDFKAGKGGQRPKEPMEISISGERARKTMDM